MEENNEIEKYEEITVPCDCGCSMLHISRDKDNAYLAFYLNAFYSKQEGYWKTFKRRIKMIWYIIRGKDYMFEDVSISIKTFKQLSKDMQNLAKKD